MGVIWFRTRVYNYGKNDEKIYLKVPKNKRNWYSIMELKGREQFTFEYYDCREGNIPAHFGLAKHIPDEDPLYKSIEVIDYFMKDSYLMFRCAGPIRENDKATVSALKEYIEGQISDGAWETGIYLLGGYPGDKVKHYYVDDNIDEVILHPFEHDENYDDVFILGNSDTLDTIIDAYVASHSTKL